MQSWSEWFKALKVRLEALFETYGKLALGIYFGMFGLTIAGFYVAISYGWDARGTVVTAGTLGAAYAMTRLTQPFRIVLTLVLVPVVSRWIGHKPKDPSEPER